MLLFFYKVGICSLDRGLKVSRLQGKSVGDKVDAAIADDSGLHCVTEPLANFWQLSTAVDNLPQARHFVRLDSVFRQPPAIPSILYLSDHILSHFHYVVEVNQVPHGSALILFGL